VCRLVCSRRQTVDRTVCANAKKPIDINKQGLNSIKNKVVQKNLMGVSESMSKKGWKDSQGRSGKVCECSIHESKGSMFAASQEEEP
jgi:hypothetical protein